MDSHLFHKETHFTLTWTRRKPCIHMFRIDTHKYTLIYVQSSDKLTVEQTKDIGSTGTNHL